MKKLFALVLILAISLVACERNDDLETSKPENYAKQSEPAEPTTNATLPEEVDPKDITPPRR